MASNVCFCGTVCQDADNLDEHHQRVHRSSVPTVCPECKRVFNRADYLRKHLARGSCRPRKAWSKYELARYRQACKANNDLSNWICCPFCPFETRPGELAEHLRAIHPAPLADNEAPLADDEDDGHALKCCGDSFASRDEVREHRRNGHAPIAGIGSARRRMQVPPRKESKMPKYVCARCLKPYVEKRRLVKHLSRCVLPCEPRGLCDRCGKQFARYNLPRHVRECDDSARDPASCPHCGACMSVWQLERHIELCRVCERHFDDIDYVCASNRAYLPGWMMQWSWLCAGQRPFTTGCVLPREPRGLCDRCGKQFVRYNVRRHVRECDGGERDPASCPHCDACMRVSQLVQHIELCGVSERHFGDISYVCASDRALALYDMQAWSWLRAGHRPFMNSTAIS